MLTRVIAASLLAAGLAWTSGVTDSPVLAQGARPNQPVRRPGNQPDPGRFLRPGDEGYGKLVNGLPSNFPIAMASGGKLVSAEEVEAKVGRSYYVRWRFQQDKDALVNWYRDYLKANQWHLVQEPKEDNMGRVRILFNGRQGGGTLMISAVPLPDGKADVVLNLNLR